MNVTKSFGYLLVIIAAAVTLVRVIVVFAGTKQAFWTSGGWELAMVVLMIVSLVYVLATGFVQHSSESSPTAGFRDPAAVRFLLSDPASATFWTTVRWYVGFAWFSAGYGKIRDIEGDWMTNGTALKGFWSAVPKLNHQGSNPALAYNWWYDFLNYMNTHEWYTWFAKLIAIGETAVGIALLLGLFTGIAAFFGATLNFSYMLTGVSGVNPLLFLLAFTLMAAWKVAGWYGVDYALLPRIGTPWQPGPVVTKHRTAA
jgi:thiosulfate dehydrogenase [quinone] large subunit